MSKLGVDQLQEQILPHLNDENFGRCQLGQALCMSRSTLFRQVKAATNISPGRFIQRFRLGCAKVLLETTNFPIAEIAHRVGFGDPNYFSRAFRKRYGIQPRRIHRPPEKIHLAERPQ